MSKITAEDVRKVAQIARLALPEEEVETYTTQLEKILDYVAQLEKINTENVLPTTRAVEVVNVLRDDVIEDSNIREDLLELGPSTEGEFYKVPKIISE